MKCPLFMIHILQEPGKVDLAKVDCLKEGCGMWDEKTGICARVALARALTAIASPQAKLAL